MALNMNLKSRIFFPIFILNLIAFTLFSVTDYYYYYTGTSTKPDILLELIFFAASSAIIYFLISYTLKPLHSLKNSTKSLVNTNFDTDRDEYRLIEKISKERGDEFGEIAGLLLYMSSMQRKYIENLDETFAAKEKIESELNVASEIQMGILPKEFPAKKEFDLHAVIRPAKNVGGDLYDYFMIDENRLFFLIGDVSDKGVPAALFMSVTKTLFSTHAYFGEFSDICNVVTRVNRQLSKDNPKLMFVTIFAGVMDIHTGDIEYVDGGHESPFIISKGNECRMLKKQEGKLPLGVMGDFQYTSHRIKLEKNESLLLYTDGVTDAKNAIEKRFGEDGIITTVSKLRANPTPRNINKSLLESLKNYSLGTTQFDDIAILTIRYNG